MRIQAPNPQPRDDGDYHVYVNGTAYGKPYAKIYLSSDDRALALDDVTLDDARRLAAAATRIERELSAAHARMAAPHAAPCPSVSPDGDAETPGEADGFAAAELASAQAIDAQERAGLREAR
jgi:hypothetical protein